MNIHARRVMTLVALVLAVPAAIGHPMGLLLLALAVILLAIAYVA